MSADDIVELMIKRMNEAADSFTDNLPTVFLNNPTPTRVRIARVKAGLKNRFVRYRRTVGKFKRKAP